jgi:hypothetical protein
MASPLYHIDLLQKKLALYHNLCLSCIYKSLTLNRWLWHNKYCIYVIFTIGKYVPSFALAAITWFSSCFNGLDLWKRYVYRLCTFQATFVYWLLLANLAKAISVAARRCADEPGSNARGTIMFCVFSCSLSIFSSVVKIPHNM